MEINNPFPILDYYSPAYFCDRQKDNKEVYHIGAS